MSKYFLALVLIVLLALSPSVIPKAQPLGEEATVLSYEVVNGFKSNITHVTYFLRGETIVLKITIKSNLATPSVFQLVVEFVHRDILSGVKSYKVTKNVTLEPGVNHVTLEWKIPDDAPYGEYEIEIVVYYNEKVCSHIHTYGGIVIVSPSKPDWVREGLYFILLWRLLEYQPGEPEEKVAELKKEIELEVNPFYERGSINITKVSEKWVVMSMRNLKQNMTWLEFNHIILTKFLGIVDPRYLAELKLPVEQLMIGGRIYVAYKLVNKTEDSIILTYFDKDSGIALLRISGTKVSMGFDYVVLALLDSNLKELAPVSTLQMLPNQANYIVNSSKAGELGEIVFEPPISDLQGLKKVNIVLDKPLATNTSIVVNLPSLIENNVVKQNVLLNLTDQSL